MNKKCNLIVSLVLIISLLATTSVALAAESKFGVTADAAIADQIETFNALKQQFTDNKPLVDIQKTYNENIQKHVQAIDATLAADAPKIDESITFVLDNAVKGALNAGQAKQAVDKGLQWYFYLLLKDLINKQAKPALEAGDKATAKVALNKAIAIYESVLEPTVVKRDAKFNTLMAEALVCIDK